MNAILTKEEWETMPGGLFDQVGDKFLKSFQYWVQVFTVQAPVVFLLLPLHFVVVNVFVSGYLVIVAVVSQSLL